MTHLFIDLETYSETDIGKCGAAKYCEDPEFQILLLSYAFDDEPVKTIDLSDGLETYPEEFLSALKDPNVVKHAWNISFERNCFKNVGLDSPADQWFDDMVLAAVCGLPMGLGAAGAALGMPEDKAKDRRGKALIRKFSCPRKPTQSNPATRLYPWDDYKDWEVYKEYNNQDVVSERAIFRKLEKYYLLPEELRFEALDTRINEKGVKLDLTLAENAILMGEKFKAELTEEAQKLSGLDNVNSVSQVKKWLLDEEGIEVESLNKKVVGDVYADLQKEESRRFLDIRKDLAKSSITKYDTMIRAACRDNHIRGCFQFYGAGRTGRFAGRLLQLQNLPQNHMDDLDEARSLVKSGDYETARCLYGSITNTLSELIRTALIPEEGARFIVCDFSAIEARVIAWLSGEEWVLDEFRGDGLIYEATASMMFGIDKQLIRKGGPRVDLRQKGKVATLACGYGGGIGAMKAFGADKMGMTEEDILEAVRLWRESNPHTVRMWSDCEKAAIHAIDNPGVSYQARVGQLVYKVEDDVLWCRLPSGRRIAYREPRYSESLKTPGKLTLSYMGQEQMSHKWVRIETFGGKLVENGVQATARDILREKMFRLDEEGYDIRCHIHDECVMTEPYSTGRTLADVRKIFAEPVSWAPGLPLRGDGYECNYYMKD